VDDKQVLDILETIVAAYPNFELSDKRFYVWQKHLSDMPYEKVMARLETHIEEKTMPPNIAEVAVKPPPKNEFAEKAKRWEEEVRAERARKP
jgi:hypothetical protein